MSRATYVLKPQLDAQVDWREPFVNHHRDAPCAAAAEVDHLALPRQGKVWRQVAGRSATCRKVPLLIVRDAQVNADLGFAVGLGHFCFAGHIGLPPHNAAHMRAEAALPVVSLWVMRSAFQHRAREA